MEPGSTYIVRVYRLSGREMAGVLEDVRTGVRIPFSGKEDLWRALRERCRQRAIGPLGSRGKTPKKGDTS